MMNEFWHRIKLLLSICIALVFIFVLDHFMHLGLHQYGVHPRVQASLPFIYTAPFLHGSWGHLMNNLVGLSIFSSFCLLRSVRFYLLSSFVIILLSGLMVWAFGRSAMHIGASGWIFGLWSLTIAMAWFDRRFINIVLALVVIVLYGGMAIGVLPRDPSVSFEYHLAGAIAGILCASLATKNKRWFKPNG